MSAPTSGNRNDYRFKGTKSLQDIVEAIEAGTGTDPVGLKDIAGTTIDPAKEGKQDTQITNQGTVGATPPTIPGTGIIGFLRSIYDRLANIVTFTFTGSRLNVDAEITGSTSIAFIDDTVDTPVEIDSATPANNTPLPVAIFNGTGEKGVPFNPLAVAAHDSQTGARQIVDLNGAAKFGEAVILVGDAFGQAVPNSLQWDTEFVGSGASITLPGTQRIETGTTADSEARFQSTKAGRFMISQFNIAHFGIEVDNIADADCRRRWGVYDPINGSANGIFFEVDGGDWSVGTVKNGVETLIPEASWNGTSKDLFNQTPNLSVYEIQYNAGSAFFFQGPNFIHRISGLASPYAALYNFKVGLEVVNDNGNDTNNGINFRAAGVYRLGEERGVTISRVFNADTLIKSTAGYCSHAYLSRTGSGGGSGTLVVYDGVDNTGQVMARVDVGGDDLKGMQVNSTFSEGLFIEVSGSGTNSATIGFE